ALSPLQHMPLLDVLIPIVAEVLDPHEPFDEAILQLDKQPKIAHARDDARMSLAQIPPQELHLPELDHVLLRRRRFALAPRTMIRERAQQIGALVKILALVPALAPPAALRQRRLARLEALLERAKHTQLGHAPE